MLEDAHLTELINKFYTIGNLRYNGKIYDNVLNIFDELDLEEQKTLIRGTLGTYAAVTSALIHEREVIDKGDTEALLAYLKRQQAKASEKSGIHGPSPESKPPPPANKDGMTEFFEAPTGSALKIALVALVFFILVHLCIIAMSDDPDAVQSAKVYKNMVEIVEVFVAK